MAEVTERRIVPIDLQDARILSVRGAPSRGEVLTVANGIDFEAERWRQDRLALAREQQRAKFWNAVLVIGPIAVAAVIVWCAL